MYRKTRVLTVILTLGLLSALLLAACAPTQPQAPAGQAPSSKLEMFSWWTAGGEADGLNAMYAIYKQKYPNVEISTPPWPVAPAPTPRRSSPPG